MNTTAAHPDLAALRARHDVTNTLVRYLDAVDNHDIEGVLAELGDATVTFGGPELRGAEEQAHAYRDAFAAGGRTRHLLHEVQVEVPPTERGGENAGTTAVGQAAYQRWSLDTDPPTLTALGRYQVRLATTHSTTGDTAGADASWSLTRLTVHRDWQQTPAPLAPPRGCQ